MTEALLKSIDAKLGALLAIAVDQHLRSTPDLARPKARSIDEMLTGVGLPIKEVASILGKTEAGVRYVLKTADEAKSARRLKRVKTEPEPADPSEPVPEVEEAS